MTTGATVAAVAVATAASAADAGLLHPEDDMQASRLACYTDAEGRIAARWDQYTFHHDEPPADHRQQVITNASNRTANVTTVAGCEISPGWPWAGDAGSEEGLVARR